jgi:hypothetical protein
MGQPLLSHLNLWKRHELRVLAVLEQALSILCAKTNLPRSEIELNRELYFCLLIANENLWKMRVGGFDHPPTSESKNQPDIDDDARAKRENKIPDFHWAFIDHAADDPRRGAHDFIIECKRLGSPPRSDWVLNENYVQNGIMRFVRPEHGYAKNEASGAMVGYIESMQPDEILTEVNAAALTAEVAAIPYPQAGWQIDGVSHLEHQAGRLPPESTLALRHLWVDLRRRVV